MHCNFPMTFHEKPILNQSEDFLAHNSTWACSKLHKLRSQFKKPNNYLK